MAIPDTEPSFLCALLARGHKQMVDDRLLRAALAVADSQEKVFFNPGEKAELQRVCFLIFTILKLNSVVNIGGHLRCEQEFKTAKILLNEAVNSQLLIISPYQR